MTMQSQVQQTPSPILAGPIVRRFTTNELVLWLVCTGDAPIVVRYGDENRLYQQRFEHGHAGHVAVNAHVHIHLLTIQPQQPFKQDCWLEYDVGLAHSDGTQWLADTLPELLYPGFLRPRIVLRSTVEQILHGSCRKPHHPSPDGLLAVDRLLNENTQKPATAQPALLMMSGDQVYCDDVAGPMLSAIYQVIDYLDLPHESLPLASFTDSSQLRSHYFNRTELLPDDPASATLTERFFAGARKPIFTSVNAENHLISFSEVLALYLLCWSPELWKIVDLDAKVTLADRADRQRFEAQLAPIKDFASSLSQARRAMAHIPCYMIFDDHDITDDWNLTKGWEQTAYGHPFSRQVIGNALLAYFVCQGWGNEPSTFSTELVEDIRSYLRPDSHLLDSAAREAIFETLRKINHWGYILPTSPTVIVLDTRTQRWWSERNQSQPSGLMNWEAMEALRRNLTGKSSVILVSPAPVFGVKLIEAVQRVFTWFGMALTVDAENWMAHRGTAQMMLNILQSPDTPEHFVILSGDVHYSFAYDVRLRRHLTTPKIWQITNSGIKNEFPPKLLKLFDKLNRWLFASYSPLNWLTRRRRFRILQRRPSPHPGRYRHQRLLNASAIGKITLDAQGQPIEVQNLLAAGGEIEFTPGYVHEWH